ncbi:MAG: SAM-dependent methyltransferase [Maritimibacter sp.]|nr:SAM-dependent methyltransferase [Maritimibacter sp.]|tara:strand:+ start:60 stop:695 length:636 start_codon:yes stop_codon:yes gene_type:complete
MSFYSHHIQPRLVHLTMRSGLLEEHRRRTVTRARGVVLELGFGSGLNLPFYQSEQITQLYALEPDVSMLKFAHKLIARATFPVEILQTGAERIPLPDQSVDTVLCTWTLCTIPSVEAALAEARRVLRPEGQFVFVEHGLSPDPKVARWQHRLTPLWRRCAGGCHLNRQADVLLRAAGFELGSVDTGYLGRPKTMTYMYEGRTQPDMGSTAC